MNRLYTQRAAAFALSAVLFTLAACHTLREPYEVAQNNQQFAGVLLGDFDIFQQAALTIGQNQTVSVDVRLKVVQLARQAKSPFDALSNALKVYQKVSADLLAGVTPDEKLQIAADNLDQWIEVAKPLLDQLKQEVRKASP